MRSHTQEITGEHDLEQVAASDSRRSTGMRGAMLAGLAAVVVATGCETVKLNPSPTYERNASQSYSVESGFRRIDSNYGSMTNPGGSSRGSWGAHTGIDFVAARGTPVFAMADGTVSVVRRTSLGGKTLRIHHGVDPDGNHFFSSYSHFSRYADVGSRGIRTGDKVKRGDVIGYVGCTGYNNLQGMPPHIHIEAYLNTTGEFAPSKARLRNPHGFWYPVAEPSNRISGFVADRSYGHSGGFAGFTHPLPEKSPPPGGNC